MNYNEYSKIEGITKSELDLIHKSIAHWKCDERREATEAMEIGSALHAAVFEPEEFGANYIVSPSVDKRTKAGKEEWEKFLAANEHKTVLSSDSNLLVMKMADAIKNHPVASHLVSNGMAETPFQWTDKSGIKCKCKPDYIRNDGVLIDLKTTADCSPDAFQRSIYNFRYHVQAAFYMDGIGIASGTPVNDFVLIAIEKSAPYGIMLYRLDDLSVDAGRIEYVDDLYRYAEHLKNPEAYKAAVYPQSLDIVEITLPAWAK